MVFHWLCFINHFSFYGLRTRPSDSGQKEVGGKGGKGRLLRGSGVVVLVSSRGPVSTAGPELYYTMLTESHISYYVQGIVSLPPPTTRP